MKKYRLMRYETAIESSFNNEGVRSRIEEASIWSDVHTPIGEGHR